jgi:predicted nicotinamide N-methyase
MSVSRLCLNAVLASALAIGSLSTVAAQDTSPGKMDKMRANVAHNREKVRACHKEAIEKNIPRRNRAIYEEECLKKSK